MWALLLLLNLVGRKNFLRLLGAWVLIMLFFLYCFVHEAFDLPQQGHVIHLRVQHPPSKQTPASPAEH